MAGSEVVEGAPAPISADVDGSNIITGKRRSARKSSRAVYAPQDDSDEDELEFDEVSDDDEVKIVYPRSTPKKRKAAGTRTRTAKSAKSGKGRPDAVKAEPQGAQHDAVNDDNTTNFVYMRHSSVKEKKKVRGRPSKTVKKLTQQDTSIEVFSTPKKQRLGILDLASPNKKGLIKSPSRKGLFRSPGLMKRQDMSARRKATQVLFSKLMDADGEGDADAEDIKFAERIIYESNHGASDSQDSPGASQDGIISHEGFVPTPLKHREDDEKFAEEKAQDKALFLDGPDGYFDQHRSRIRTSNNSMVQAPQLEYDEFNSLICISGFIHHDLRNQLNRKYTEMFNEWYFELIQKFNLCFYGIGSKRKLLLQFVDYLCDKEDLPVVVINGYNPGINFKDLLMVLVDLLKLKKIPKRLSSLVDFVIKSIEESDTKIVLLVHNIDGKSLRDEKTQFYLSKLSSLKQVYLVCSIDTINYALLWDSVKLTNYNFLTHHVSTFEDYLIEMTFNDLLILGQTQRNAGSKGAKYVLSSLTENSKGLFRVLVSTQLENMEEENSLKRAGGGLKGTIKHGVELKRFYLLCAEEFITTNEINFRTMLMEFVEHKMAVIGKEPNGTEIVYIPFLYEELLKLLEDELT